MQTKKGTDVCRFSPKQKNLHKHLHLAFSKADFALVFLTGLNDPQRRAQAFSLRAQIAGGNCTALTEARAETGGPLTVDEV
ncbi:MAG: hypothetical protein IJW15_00550 [Clostridia bacterium]|nr:hypothetical protein [Clostridia bacterium]